MSRASTPWRNHAPPRDRTVSARATVATMAWLDAAQLRHRVRLVLSNPRRLLPWLLFAGLIGLGLSLRTHLHTHGMASRGPTPQSAFSLTELEPTVPGVVLIVLGLTIARARSGAPASFSHPADGRFLIGSRLEPHVVVIWLFLRRAVGRAVGVPLAVLPWLFFVNHAPINLIALIPDFFIVLLLVVINTSLALPSFVLAQRNAPVRTVGTLILGIGGVAVAAVVALHAHLFLASAGLRSTVGIVDALSPGGWALNAFAGSAVAWSGLVALAAALMTATAMVAGDVYPELWNGSQVAIATRGARLARNPEARAAARALLKRQIAAARAERGKSYAPSTRQGAGSSFDRVPSGALAIAWRQWVELRRGRVGLRGSLAITAAAGVVGFLAPLLVGANALPLLAGVAADLLVVANALTGYRLADELRQPLWWLNRARLDRQLLVWTFVGSLRQSIPLLVATTALALSAHAPTALLALPVVFVLPWLLRASGTVAITIFPSRTDLRGPAMFLRVILLPVLVVPAAVVAGGAAHLAGPVAAVFVGRAAAAAESWGLVEFSARRLQGNGLAMVRAQVH